MDRPYSFFETLCHEEEIQDINAFLSLGSAKASQDAQTLKQHRITHILTVHPTLPFKFNNLKYHRIPLLDDPLTMLSPYIPDALAFLDGAKEKKGRVLVHCQKGISRSTAFVFIYLMRREKLTFEEAFTLVENKRKQAFPNIGFQAQLARNCEISAEEVSFDVLAKVQDRLAEATSFVDSLLSGGGVALSQTRERWKTLGLFFENLHKYKFIPKHAGLDEEKLRLEAEKTVQGLQSIEKIFTPTMEGVKLSKNLAAEIMSWIKVLEESHEGSESSDEERTEKVKNKKEKKKEKKKKKKEKKKEKKKVKKKKK